MTKYVRLPITDSSLDQFACSVSDPLRFGLELIRTNNAGFCIVREGDQMVGILCESEIRRAWVKGADLEDLCGKFVNRDPVKIGKSGDLIFKDGGISHIVVPEIDENTGSLVAVWQVSRPEWKPDDMVVLIMAGGRGLRMGQLTDHTPKPLLEISPGISLLDNVLDALSKVNFKKVRISVNYLRDEFFRQKKQLEAKAQIRIEFLEENEFLGTAGPIRYAVEENKGMLVMNGDVYSNASLNAFLNYSYSTKADMVIMGARQIRQEQFGVLSLDEDSKLTDFTEKPTSIYFVAAGVYYFSSRILGELSNLISVNNFDMPDLIKSANNCGFDVRVFPIFEEWMDVGNPGTLAQIRRELDKT